MTPETSARALSPAAVWAAAAVACALALHSGGLGAQAPAQPQQPRAGRLTGLEKQQLLSIAAEPVAALREGREPRVPQVTGTLAASLPLVVSLYLDGKLVARHWEIQRPGPLASSAMILSAQALAQPRWGKAPLPTDAPRLKCGILVMHGFVEIKDDSELPDGYGAVVMNGFKEGVAGPMDVDPGAKPSAVLSFASEIAGMRPGGWLVPESALFASPADEARE
ncbi:MAG: hypothetical protein LBQ12_12310 [Deltaproteobacteria bacterium]|jgi:hypothetical protein|nr:hypothetical protein [Deltaproteobacteria bacterium]